MKMRKKIGWGRKLTGGAAAVMAAWMAFSPTAQALRTLPDTYRLAVGYQESVRVGPATILFAVDGSGIRAYGVYIEWMPDTAKQAEEKAA